MEIGIKLKTARTTAHLTQEQAAEALGVSRQTISNWENQRTYPDIVSVVKMSDLYAISLDELLKDKPPQPKEEEKPMNDYLTYLDESTNVVKSNEKRSKLAILLTYLGVWALSLIVFWFMMAPDDAMGFSLVFLWLVLPVTTLILSLIIGKNDYWGSKKWFSAVFFGIMYMLAEYGTFSAANMAYFHHFNLPEWGMLANGAVISLVGLVAGHTIKSTKGKTATKKQ